MMVFVIVEATLVLVAVFGLIWQLAPQGARGQWAPIIILLLFALSLLLLTPISESVFARIWVNSAYLTSHLCLLTAVALASLHWGHHFSPRPLARGRLLATRTAYGLVAVVLIYLFATSAQYPHGIGFGREFSESPRMRLYWVIQAILIMHAMTTLAGTAARACARERHSRRGLLGLLMGAALVFTAYEAWVIVVVLTWPAMPPLWAQHLTSTLTIAASLLLVAGTIGAIAMGTFRTTSLALAYLERLAPLHDWLTRRYPQVRLESRRGRRAETRVTDMLIEIGDALRLLQRDAPALAAAHRLDDDTIRAAALGTSHHAAYEMTAAGLFGSHIPRDLAMTP